MKDLVLVAIISIALTSVALGVGYQAGRVLGVLEAVILTKEARAISDSIEDCLSVGTLAIVSKKAGQYRVRCRS